MGPVIIFDKSTLESLNPDEAMWLDHFFISNITPLFFIETLADLEKKLGGGRKPEDIVGSLAYKTPDMNSRPNVHHATLLAGELSGAAKIDMRDRPIVSGGKTMELGGKMGIIFQTSPEEEAFSRWQKHQFLELERSRAKAWRRNLSNVRLEESYESFQRFFPLGKAKTYADVKSFVDFYLDGPDQEEVLIFGLLLLDIPEHSRIAVLKRWKSEGKKSIREFAPYFTHVFSVDMFFYLAIAADLVGRGRPSHKIDLAYLYYLPFCKVFTSSDKLHVNIAPFFLGENQTFVPGAELKSDLEKLDRHYDALPDDEKERGVISFAFYPPSDDSFLVSRLWDKYMSPTWRQDRPIIAPQPDTPDNRRLVDQIKRFKAEGTPVPDETRINSDEADHIGIERSVHARKGKWIRFPPEIISRRKNKEGEWEDTPLE